MNTGATTRSQSGPAPTRVAVIGAGVVGLAVAWELLRSGCAVEVFDDSPATGATHAAAGMLAPLSEAAHGEGALLRVGLESLALWPRFAAALESAAGSRVGLRTHGTLVTAHDADDARELHRFASLLAAQGQHVEALGSAQARSLEPALSPRVVAALAVPGDHSVDNRLLTTALLTAVRRAGGRLHHGRAGLVVTAGRATGVRPVAGGTSVGADVVVLAAGSESAVVPGLPTQERPPVRPVKGQILRLHGSPGLIEHTVRARVGGQLVYLVPRDDGELVVGATSEEVGKDTRVTAGAVLDLLRRAAAVVPDVAELELVEAVARLRPATPDNAPVIGWSGLPGLLLATGHHRGGVLLAPATGRAVRELVAGRPVPGALNAFAPQRFQPPAASPHPTPQES